MTALLDQLLSGRYLATLATWNPTVRFVSASSGSGAASSGAIEILGGAGARELNERIWRKYLTPEGLDAPDLGGAIRANDDVTIRLTPDRWRTWGTGADFGGAFEISGTSFPLDP